MGQRWAGASSALHRASLSCCSEHPAQPSRPLPSPIRRPLPTHSRPPPPNHSQPPVLSCQTQVVLEWDRVYLTVLGVAGRRLYEFRLQVGSVVGYGVVVRVGCARWWWWGVRGGCGLREGGGGGGGALHSRFLDLPKLGVTKAGRHKATWWAGAGGASAALDDGAAASVCLPGGPDSPPVINRPLRSSPCPPLPLQAANSVYEADPERLLTVERSFQCREVAAP